MSEFAALCQRCGYAFDATSSPTNPDLLPHDGDLSVCLACGELAAFVDTGFGMLLRNLTPAERKDALERKDVVALLLGRQAAAEKDEEWPMRNQVL